MLVVPLLDEELLDEVVRPLLDEVLLDDVRPLLEEVVLDDEVPLLLGGVLRVEELAPLEVLRSAPLVPAPLALAVAGRVVVLPPVPVIPRVAPPPCPPVPPPAPSHAGTNPSEANPANKTVLPNCTCLDIARPPDLAKLKSPLKRG